MKDRLSATPSTSSHWSKGRLSATPSTWADSSTCPSTASTNTASSPYDGKFPIVSSTLVRTSSGLAAKGLLHKGGSSPSAAGQAAWHQELPWCWPFFSNGSCKACGGRGEAGSSRLSSETEARDCCASSAAIIASISTSSSLAASVAAAAFAFTTTASASAASTAALASAAKRFCLSTAFLASSSVVEEATEIELPIVDDLTDWASASPLERS